MDGATNREAFLIAIARWNSGDLDGYFELYADDLQLHGYSEQPMTKPEARAFYENLWSALSGMEIHTHEIVEDDDHLCARFTLTGTHTGELAGVPATGRTITQPGITILRFRDGLVVERWSVADMLAVLTQIGALPG